MKAKDVYGPLSPKEFNRHLGDTVMQIWQTTLVATRQERDQLWAVTCQTFFGLQAARMTTLRSAALDEFDRVARETLEGRVKNTKFMQQMFARGMTECKTAEELRAANALVLFHILIKLLEVESEQKLQEQTRAGKDQTALAAGDLARYETLLVMGRMWDTLKERTIRQKNFPSLSELARLSTELVPVVVSELKQEYAKLMIGNRSVH